MTPKLSFDSDYSPEYCMLGISSHLLDYKLVLNINKALNFQFVKKDDLEYNPDQSKEKGSYSLFYFVKKSLEIDYFILANRGAKSFLIPEFRQFDYFFLLKCCNSKKEMANLSVKINEIENVQTVFVLDLNKIKHINHLFNDLELHLMDKKQL